MDQFFDCLNVSKIESKKMKKPTLKVYSSLDDWRFEWLEGEFLSFFDEWEEQAQNVKDTTESMKKRTCLVSKETVCGIRISVHSFVQLTQHLLSSVPGLKFILSNKYNQDPLEEYLSKQCGIGRSYNNPTVVQFGHNMLVLHVAGQCISSSKKANCKASSTDSQLDTTPLQRRK